MASTQESSGLSRREFAAGCGALGAAFTLAPWLLKPNLADAEDYDLAEEADQKKFVEDVNPATGKIESVPEDQIKEVDRRFYETLDNKAIKCYVCARNCYLPNGKTCRCYVRKNHGGVLKTHAWNNPCIVQFDKSVEIGPFAHFLPGAHMAIVATAGCMLRCLYCQNWQISQKKPEWTHNKRVDGRRLIAYMKRSGSMRAVCYTFTEPIAFYDYMVATAKVAQKAGYKNLMCTSGYINEKPLRELFPLIDGFCITMKGFTEKFYVKVCGAELAPVLHAMETVAKAGKWLEVPILLVPGYNDRPQLIRDMCKWIRDHLGPMTPVHFAKFEPRYKMRNVTRTPIKTVKDAREAAMKIGLKYVYISNFPGLGQNTKCHRCGTTLIRRMGVKLLSCRIRRGRCPKCRTKIPGVWT